MTELSTFSRFVSVLHSLPLWILAGLAGAGYAGLFAPSLAGVDLGEFRKTWGPFLWIDAVGFTVLTAACALDLVVRWLDERAKRSAKQRRKILSDRYYYVYAPLFAQLIKIHITTGSSEAAPYFAQRLSNAWLQLTAIKKPRAAVKRAWRALFDRRRSEPTGEVDFGGEFPISSIRGHVESSLTFADDTLIELVLRAWNNRIEAQLNDTYLAYEDVQLHDYIVKEHNRLKKLVRA
jgi:hypothetical protein